MKKLLKKIIKATLRKRKYIIYIKYSYYEGYVSETDYFDTKENAIEFNSLDDAIKVAEYITSNFRVDDSCLFRIETTK